MADFRFLHAADIHLDSPLHGLARYEGVPLEEVRGATRAAFDRLIQFAIDQAVDFVVIAGDLFDGDWRDMGTGLYFARAMGRLAKADIPAFTLQGNHDAASVLTKALPWPRSVSIFPSKAAASFRLDRLGVALHGRSFPTQHVYDDLAAAYPAADPDRFNIGVLHTALSGVEGHQPYAPTSVEALQAKGYDYWALGHVHDFHHLGEGAPVVFPGNLQGRNIRETGPKGAVLVEVHDRTVSAVRFFPLHVLQWERVRVDCTGMDSFEAVHAAVRAGLAEAYTLADGRPVIARVQLCGATPLSGALRDRAGDLRDEVRALASALGPDLWLEKLSIQLEAPALAPRLDDQAPDDLLDLLGEAALSPDLADALAAELKPFLNGRPATAEGAGEDLAASAERGDWAAVLRAAVAALPARLGVGAP
jgi:DNA repair exonuclease SbcCD nuclease subunit